MSSRRKWIAAVCLAGALIAGSSEERQGRQATVASSASTNAAGPGDRVTLVLDVTLRPGMHVYAPGVQSYIPVSWKLKDSKLYTARDVVMPEAKVIYLPVIDEKVPVYEGHFRLTRDVTVGPEDVIGPLIAAHTGLRVEGTFRYQACDDRMCYVPDTVPVTWTFSPGRHGAPQGDSRPSE